MLQKLMNKKSKIVRIILLVILITLSLKFKDVFELRVLVSDSHILESKKQNHKITYVKYEDIGVATDMWKTSPAVCLKSQEGDSNLFGLSTAINNKYLAVGDPGANKVIIYSRDQSNNWMRIREIKPPKDSIPEKVGFGFGRNLALGGDVLVIAADIQQSNRKVINPEYFQLKSILNSRHISIYKVDLDKKNTTTHIHTNREKETPNGSIAINNRYIAVITSYLNKKNKRVANVVLLPNREANKITTNKSIRGKELFYPLNVSLNNSKLLMSKNDASYDVNTYAWLLDLNSPHQKLEELNIDRPVSGNNSDISEKFIVIGAELLAKRPDDKMQSVIIIREIRKGNTTIVENNNYYNEFSLDKDTLLVKRNPHPFYGRASGIIEAFTLDDNAFPHLIMRREIEPHKQDHIKHAVLQGGFLVTVMENGKICIENTN